MTRNRSTEFFRLSERPPGRDSSANREENRGQEAATKRVDVDSLAIVFFSKQQFELFAGNVGRRT